MLFYCELPIKIQDIAPNDQKYLSPSNLAFISVCILLAGLPTSNSLMSIGQAGLAVAWIWGAGFREKFQRLRARPALWLFACAYAVFLAGMIITENFPTGWKELRVKLPMVLLPLLLGSLPAFSRRHTKWLLNLLLLVLVAVTLIGFGIFAGWVPRNVTNSRDYSPFISSIRLSTLLVFGIFLAGWLTRGRENDFRIAPRILYPLLCFWFFLFLVLLQSLTGIIILAVICWLVLLRLAVKPRPRFALIAVCIVLPLSGYLYLSREVSRFYDFEKVDYSALPYSTKDGAIYKYDTLSKSVENGHYVDLYISHWELKREWAKRSSIGYDENTARGWPVRGTLIRYITSKGQRKNAAAVRNLSDREVKAIEKGVTNYLYLQPFSLRGRVYEVIYEHYIYSITGNPSGASSTMRLEIWKQAWAAAQSSLLIGHGTGDVHDVLKKTYSTSGTKLEPKYWYEPHNQYLSVVLATGIAGLFLFLFFIFNPVILQPRNIHFLFAVFLLVICIAMTDEDTLGSQAGATQVSLLYVLLAPGLLPLFTEKRAG